MDLRRRPGVLIATAPRRTTCVSSVLLPLDGFVGRGAGRARGGAAGSRAEAGRSRFSRALAGLLVTKDYLGHFLLASGPKSGELDHISTGYRITKEFLWGGVGVPPREKTIARRNCSAPA